MATELQQCLATFDEFETGELPELVNVLAAGLRREARALQSVGGSPEKLAWRLINRDCLGMVEPCSWECWIKRVPQDLVQRCEARTAAAAKLLAGHLAEALHERDRVAASEASVDVRPGVDVETTSDARAWREALGKSRRLLATS